MQFHSIGARFMVLTRNRATLIMTTSSLCNRHETRILSSRSRCMDRSRRQQLTSCQEILMVANKVAWIHSMKKSHTRKKRDGLHKQWIYPWDVSRNSNEALVIPQENLELSPTYCKWYKKHIEDNVQTHKLGVLLCSDKASYHVVEKLYITNGDT